MWKHCPISVCRTPPGGPLCPHLAPLMRPEEERCSSLIVHSIKRWNGKIPSRLLYLDKKIFFLLTKKNSSTLKFRYSEKATKFWKNLPILLTLPSNFNYNGWFSSNVVAFSEYLNCIELHSPHGLTNSQFQFPIDTIFLTNVHNNPTTSYLTNQSSWNCL